MTTTMIPKYNTILFTDVWDSEVEFYNDIKDSPFATILKDDSLRTVYYLLYANYGNTPIANRDVTQFQYKIFSIIFAYGPAWEKKLDLQTKLRNLTDEEIVRGSKSVHNSALNPDSLPGTESLEELQNISSQNTTNIKKALMEAYSELFMRLEEDFTADFIDKFKICFKQFVRHENPILYYEEEEEDE